MKPKKSRNIPSQRKLGNLGSKIPWQAWIYREETFGDASPNSRPDVPGGKPGKPWIWKEWKFRCFGTLISRNTVVTSAGCIESDQLDDEDCKWFVTTPERCFSKMHNTWWSKAQPPKKRVELLKSAKRYRVVLGKRLYRKKKQLITNNPKKREVKRIFVHPNYGYDKSRNDIAILKLKKTLKSYSSSIRPACAPQIANWKTGKTMKPYLNDCYMTGGKWITQKKRIAPAWTRITVRNLKRCKKTFKDKNAALHDRYHICAGNPNKVNKNDAEMWDGGSGLVCVVKEKRKEKVNFAGIFQFAHKKSPGVYTNANEFSNRMLLRLALWGKI